MNTLAMPPGNQLIRFPINYVTPERNASGSIRNHLSLNSIVNSKFQSHCMIQPFTNDGMLRSGAYTKEGQAYRWAMTLDMPEGRTWTPIPWAVIAQVHANNWGPARGETQQPMISLNIEQNQWRGFARGCDEVNPTGYTHSTNVFSPFVPGKQQVIIEWRLDPLSEFTGNAYCKMTVNGTTFLDVTHPVGVNCSGLGASDTGGWMSHGYYGGHPERLVAAGSDASLQPWVDIEYSRLTEIP